MTELVEAIRDPSRGLCCQATFVLSDLGSGDDAEAAGALLEDPRAHVRWHAVSALGEIGKATSLAALALLAADDVDPGVREAAARAVTRIREGTSPEEPSQ